MAEKSGCIYDNNFKLPERVEAEERASAQKGGCFDIPTKTTPAAFSGTALSFFGKGVTSTVSRGEKGRYKAGDGRGEGGVVKARGNEPKIPLQERRRLFCLVELVCAQW